MSVSPTPEMDGAVPTNSLRISQPSLLQKISTAIVGNISKFFYKLGVLIARYPWVFILTDLLITIVFVPGIPLYFYEETAQEKLWVPYNSVAQDDKKWVDKNFPASSRFESMILVAGDVLTPDSLNAMMDLHLEIVAIEEPQLHNWTTICYRLGPECWTNSLLELWSFNEVTIRTLTRQDILDKVNSVTNSPVFFNEVDIEKFIGDITRDNNGDITGAKAASMSYVLKSDSTLSDQKDETAKDWEAKFKAIGAEGHDSFTEVFYFTVRSFGDEGGGRIAGDIPLLSSGYLLIILFVVLVLGKFNKLQQRIYVTLGGILCVGLAIAVSIGLCSYAGVPYGPLHNVLPFLVIGIGVDDMFVIVQSWENIEEETQGQRLEVTEKVGRMLEHAGVSITVTSLTDILAFGVGASTVLPALQSFCIYCCIGIIFTYLFQATFFVACVSIDQKRVSQNRDACCCCLRYGEDYEPRDCSKQQYAKVVFEKYYAPFLMMPIVQVILSVVTLAEMGSCIWGVVRLEQEFNPIWFLPPDGSAYKYAEASDRYFPDDSIISAGVYLGDIDYYNGRDNLLALHQAVVDDPYVDAESVTNWHQSFNNWLDTTSDPAVTSKLDADGVPLTEADFYDLLDSFITTIPEGIVFSRDIVFTNADNNHIQASRMSLRHKSLGSSRERVAAMDSLRAAVSSFRYDHQDCFAYSRQYLSFESDKAIQNELYRNIGLAFLCVVIMTLVLIAHPWTCALVCISVLMALVDIGGSLYFWGLTIDTVTTVNLIVAVGLTVDYSAHIGHTFMTVTGTRNERTVQTLASIGPAVMYGGFSTFLAFILLAGSKSYVFQTFFKVFLSVVGFGLYHGLVVLPVLLSWAGPDPYHYVTSGSVSAPAPDQENSTRELSSDSQEEEGIHYVPVRDALPLEQL